VLILGVDSTPNNFTINIYLSVFLVHTKCPGAQHSVVLAVAYLLPLSAIDRSYPIIVLYYIYLKNEVVIKIIINVQYVL